MKRSIQKLTITILSVTVLLPIIVRGQMITNDPIHTAITTMMKLFQDPSFKTMVKNIEQLKKISGAVQQFHRGKEIISKIQNCTQKISSLSTAVSKDGHIYPTEYSLMVQDITKLSKVGTDILKDMKSSTTQSGGVLKMSDAERVRWLDDTYIRVCKFEQLLNTYFSNIQSLSLRRSGNRNDLKSTAKLYSMVSSSTGAGYGGVVGNIGGSGYDDAYDQKETSSLDSAYTSEQAKKIKEMQELCTVRMQNYQDELQLAEKKMEGQAVGVLLGQGWDYQVKPPKFSLFSSMAFSIAGEIADAVNGTGNAAIGGGGTTDVTQQIEDSIQCWINPSGKKVSNDEFLTYLRIKTREMILEQKLSETLRKKHKLDECQSLGMY
ncbi:MAG: hypothetical protein ACOVO2_04045 [Emticicia sp.]|uniref:hypothetical protein n=1 Tax=Emticicia sp. TaxID=1930953 RepID=UPI003BA6C86C